MPNCGDYSTWLFLLVRTGEGDPPPMCGDCGGILKCAHVEPGVQRAVTLFLLNESAEVSCYLPDLSKSWIPIFSLRVPNARA